MRAGKPDVSSRTIALLPALLARRQSVAVEVIFLILFTAEQSPLSDFSIRVFGDDFGFFPIFNRVSKIHSAVQK